jgi:hypothetical protein
MVGAEEWGKGPGPATGAKVLFGPGTGGILWVQWSGLRHPAYESRMIQQALHQALTPIFGMREPAT